MILEFLKEHLLSEARFDITKPENFQFYGVDSIESEADDKGNAMTRLIGPYIFVFNENMYDMDIKTILKYPLVRNEQGFIRYDESGGGRLKPVYVDAEGLDYDLTDGIIKQSEEVQRFLASVKDQLIVKVILDFSFDISEDDPTYDPENSFDTLNSGSAADVFRKLNNVAYLIKDYISNFANNVASDVTTQVFGNKYTLLTSNFKYYLTDIEFVGKQDVKDDMRRTNLYKKWFGIAGNEMGTMTALDVDGVDFDAKYKDTRIA